MTQLTRHALRLLPLAMAAAFAAPAQAQSLSALYESARGQDAAWQSATSSQ
jgi:hypothetical protein